MSEEDATDSPDAPAGSTTQNRSDSDSNGGDQTPTEEATQEGSASAVSESEEVDGEYLEWVSEAPPEEVARAFQDLQNEVETLRAERDTLEGEVETLEERVQRVQADFQNYKKRTQRRREEEEARATQDLVDQLLPVRDNLARALDQDEDSEIRDGVQATLTALDDVFEAEGVEVIEPSPGDAVDPTRHEVVHREDEEAEAVASVYRRGYEMGGQVLRPAQVTVGSAEEGVGTPIDADDSGSEPEADQ